MRTSFVHAVVAATVALAVACSSSDPSSNSSGGTSGSSGGTSGSSGGTSGSSGGTAGSSGGTNSGGTKFKSCPPVSDGTTCTDADWQPYNACVLGKCEAGYKQCYGSDFQNGNFSGACGSYMECIQSCGCNDTQCFMACKPDAACQECALSIATCGDGCTEPACAEEGPTSGTCDDLQACCDAISDAEQQEGCQAAKDAASGDDVTCGQYYSGFKAGGLCP